MYKVLLVDDEFMILNGLKMLIPWKELHLECVGTAENGKEALEFVRHNEVDIVLSDITMPILTGLEFLKHATEEDWNVQTIFLSGYQEFSYVKEGLSLGAVDYLLKPVNEEELIAVLSKAILLLDQEKEALVQRNQIDTYLFVKGLENGITEAFINHYQLEGVEGFSVFIVEDPTKAFVDYLTDERTAVFCQRGQQLVGFFFHLTKVETQEKYQKMSIAFPLIDFYQSCYQTNVYALHNAFNQANAQLQRVMFYQGLRNEDQRREEGEVIELSKDYYVEDVSQEVLKMIDYFKRNNCMPEQVKQLTIQFTVNIQRFFNVWNEVDFQVEVSRIPYLTNISEVEDYYYQILLIVEQHQEITKYSHLTRSTIRTIHQRYHEDLRLRDIADELFVNAMYLGQVIKKETGQTFSQYFNDYRMKQAERLIVQTQKNINEIAFEVGYTSAGYFNRMFKEVYQVTPKEYREKMNRPTMP